MDPDLIIHTLNFLDFNDFIKTIIGLLVVYKSKSSSNKCRNGFRTNLKIIWDV